jgi:hypothetical protein
MLGEYPKSLLSTAGRILKDPPRKCWESIGSLPTQPLREYRKPLHATTERVLEVPSANCFKTNWKSLDVISGE